MRASIIVARAPPAYASRYVEPSGQVSPQPTMPVSDSTRTTVPLLSAAVALIVTVAGAVYVAPLAGLVMATVGGWFAGALTVTRAVDDVVVAPPSSIATPVRSWTPAGTSVHVAV